LIAPPPSKVGAKRRAKYGFRDASYYDYSDPVVGQQRKLMFNVTVDELKVGAAGRGGGRGFFGLAERA
jgi:hypothetical protein